MPRACADAEWFEDYRVGDAFASEAVAFTEDEIVTRFTHRQIIPTRPSRYRSRAAIRSRR